MRKTDGRFLLALLAASATVPVASQVAAPASPLAAYPGFGHNPTADEARYRREQAARERLIAVCMRDRGFRYTPAPAQEFAAGNAQRAERGSPPPRDPNEAFAATLAGEERQRYYLGLYGVPDPNDQEAQLWRPGSSTGGGCWGDALRTYPGVYVARSELAAEFSEMRRSVLDDPGVRAAEGRWAACMAGRGFSWESPRAMYEGAAGASASGSASSRQPDRQVDTECREQAGLGQAVREARVAREAAFVATHKARLDAFLGRLSAQPPAQ